MIGFAARWRLDHELGGRLAALSPSSLTATAELVALKPDTLRGANAALHITGVSSIEHW